MKVKMSFNFIETKERRYFISDSPVSAINTMGLWLTGKENIFLVNTSDDVSGDYVKAHIISVKDILSYGNYHTVKEYDDEEREKIIKAGIFNGQPIYKMV